MTAPENNGLIRKQAPSGGTRTEAALYEDEVSLSDFLAVLWKHRYFISSATILPTLALAVVLWLLPRNYKVTYVYNVKDDDKITWNLNEKNYMMLLNRFYSENNLSRLTDKLRQNSLGRYAERLDGEAAMKLVTFKVVPSFPDFSKSNITDPDQLNKIGTLRASLLNVTITGKAMEDMYKLSSIIRDNVENTMLLYMAQEQLSAATRSCNNDLADIECKRFDLELELKNNNETLAGLKRVNVAPPDNAPSGVVLQFDVGNQGQYLPLSYQIQAAESKKLRLEENIKTNEGKYNYYSDLLDSNNRILAELDNNLLSDYTTEQFKAFLVGLADGCEMPQLKNYLSSYIRLIDNKLSAKKSVVEKPNIYPIAKGTARKSGIAFIVSFIISGFVAFLLESLDKTKIGIP